MNSFQSGVRFVPAVFVAALASLLGLTGLASAGDRHRTDVQKVEVQLDLDPGQQKSVIARCPSGFFVTDGSVRIDHVDQGTGSLLSPRVLESYANTISSWRGVVRNTASGRAQAKAFAVCVRRTTSPNSHSHGLIVRPRVVRNLNVGPGVHWRTLRCPAGRVAIQPGFRTGRPAELFYSQPAGNGWRFGLRTGQPNGVQFSINCLSVRTAVSQRHRHRLLLRRVVRTVTVDPGKVENVKLTCPTGSKGIVGGWALQPGLFSLGNDPQPISRVFRLFNPTGFPRQATLTLLCLGNRTGSAF